MLLKIKNISYLLISIVLQSIKKFTLIKHVLNTPVILQPFSHTTFHVQV